MNALRYPATEVGDIVKGETEASGADERAIAAGEAALGHLSPPRMLHVALQQLFEPFGLQPTTHACGSSVDDLLGALSVRVARRIQRQRARDIDARLASHLDKKCVSLAIEKLREGKVEAVINPRPGSHRHTEARITGAPAVDSNNERVFPPRRIRPDPRNRSE